MAMELTTEAKNRIAETLGATGEFVVRFRDGKVERVPARSVVVDGRRMIVATEGIEHAAGTIDRVELYDEAGRFVLGCAEPFSSGLGGRLELQFDPITRLSSSSYCPS